MNMGLLAADLSLGSSSVQERSGSVQVHSEQKQQHLFYGRLSTSGDLRALEVYHKALEEERLKIQAFERELPFCMQLLQNAIEASKEQLEERLACKLNTPLHEPQIAAATAAQEFVCNYSSSLSQRSSLPALAGEINLRLERKWTSMPASSSTHDCAHDLYNHTAASACTTKWLLPQHNKFSPNEDSPISIKGSVKLQEFLGAEHPLQVCADEPHKSTSEIVWNTKSIALNSISAIPTHARRLHNPKQALYSSVGHQRMHADAYMLAKMKNVPMVDVEAHQHYGGASIVPVRLTNDMVSFDGNRSPTGDCSSTPHSLTKELQISTAMLQSGCHGSGAAPHSGGVQRKPRRCWSPELHQRFLSALNHLGGCQVATPKQIRELMNVEGLTNDEVKSHLQKFRLHMRRPNGSVLANSSHSDPKQSVAAGHHLVVFGHIWVPPDHQCGDQHAANANIDIISSEVSSANGAMELMKSFRNSCGSKLNAMDHALGLNHAQHGPAQCDSGVTRVGLLRFCQEEYCSDEDQLMHESKGLHEIQLLGERKVCSPHDVDDQSECCKEHQSGTGCDDDHRSDTQLCALQDRLPRPADYIQQDLCAAAVAGKKGEGGKLHLLPAAGDQDAVDNPDCKLSPHASTDQVGSQQLLQLHEEDKSDSMNE